MSAKQHFTTEQARKIGDKLGIDWSRSNVEQFRICDPTQKAMQRKS